MSKGDYSYLQAAMGYAGIPLLLLPLGMEYILPKTHKELVGSFFSNYTVLSVLISILSIVVLGLFNIQTQVFQITIAYVFSGITYTAFFEMYGKQLQLSLRNFIAIGLQVIVFYLLIRIKLPPLMALISAYLCGNLSRFSLHFIYVRKLGFKREKFGRTDQFYKLFKEAGMPMIGVSLLGFTFGGLVRIFVETGDILAELGVVFQVVSLYSFWFSLIDKIYRYDLIMNLDILRFSAYLIFLMAPILLFILVTENVNIFSIIWGESYSKIDPINLLVSLLLFSISLKHVSNIIANSLGKSKALLIINIISACVFLYFLVSYSHTLRHILYIISGAYILIFTLLILSTFDRLFGKRV
ncbi:hypothetical protein N9P75_01105 [Schleiferiaceae bacterium]|nr:hypothetical protein [Schleiferiaceae bacterium]